MFARLIRDTPEILFIAAWQHFSRRHRLLVVTAGTGRRFFVRSRQRFVYLMSGSQVSEKSV
jgi:hypothetical protein